MKNKTFHFVIIVGLLTFMSGWFVHGLIQSSRQTKDSQADTKNIEFIQTVSGHFILTKSNCAGFNFLNKNIVLWTNEIACYDPDTLKLRWLSDATFMTRSTHRMNENCPPKVDIYEVVSYDGKRLVLKEIWTGWNDSNDGTLEFIKQSD